MRDVVYVVAVDETDNWSPEFRAETNITRIRAVYLISPIFEGDVYDPE